MSAGKGMDIADDGCKLRVAADELATALKN